MVEKSGETEKEEVEWKDKEIVVSQLKWGAQLLLEAEGAEKGRQMGACGGGGGRSMAMKGEGLESARERDCDKGGLRSCGEWRRKDPKAVVCGREVGGIPAMMLDRKGRGVCGVSQKDLSCFTGLDNPRTCQIQAWT